MSSTCDACGATGSPLAKVSLGRDFFGRAYDRLTPASDRSPAWYCPRCSEEKRMQSDYRVIKAAAEALAAGAESPLADPKTRDRAAERLGRIVERLGAGLAPGQPFAQKLLTAPEVEALRAGLKGAGVTGA
jgi:hypothetical protein